MRLGVWVSIMSDIRCTVSLCGNMALASNGYINIESIPVCLQTIPLYQTC